VTLAAPLHPLHPSTPAAVDSPTTLGLGWGAQNRTRRRVCYYLRLLLEMGAASSSRVGCRPEAFERLPCPVGEGLSRPPCRFCHPPGPRRSLGLLGATRSSSSSKEDLPSSSSDTCWVTLFARPRAVLGGVGGRIRAVHAPPPLAVSPRRCTCAALARCLHTATRRENDAVDCKSLAQRRSRQSASSAVGDGWSSPQTPPCHATHWEGYHIRTPYPA
jgi:hypothetical protein